MRERASLGLPYLANEPSLVRDRLRARRVFHAFNNSLPSDVDPKDLEEGEEARGIGGSHNAASAPPDVMGSERRRLFAQLLQTDVESLGAVEVEPPFWWSVLEGISGNLTWLILADASLLFPVNPVTMAPTSS